MATEPLVEDDIERFLDAHDIAERLRVERRTIDRMVARGEFPAPLKLGALRRWRVATFNAWVAQQQSGKR